MAGSDPSLSYAAPGDFAPPAEPSGRIIDPRSLIGNALWKSVKSGAEGLWQNVIKPPGQILEGSLTPSMEPGSNQLAVPEYALELLGTAMGTRGLGFSAPEGALTHFPVYQGTGARKVFTQHDDAFLGTGEGTAYEGPGHYTAERQGVADEYRKQLARSDQVPVDEQGLPLSGADIVKKFYEPGSIVPSYGGSFDKVVKLNEEDPQTGRWSVDVRSARPDHDLIANKYGHEVGGYFLQYGRLPNNVLGDNGLLKDPSLWRETGGTRNHATFPSEYEIGQAASANPDKWPMGEPGGLLHINVVPEKNEYLDMNAPWKDQDQGVKERLEKAFMAPEHLDPQYYQIHEDTHIPNTPGSEHQYMTGRDLFWSHVNQRSNEIASDAVARGDADPFAVWPSTYTDQAATEIGQEMDKAGVPGRKFLDRPSRQVGPVLAHDDNFNGMPGVFALDHIMREPLSPGVFNVGDAVQAKINALQNHVKSLDDLASMQWEYPRQRQGVLSNKSFTEQAIDWMQQEKEAGRFSLDDNKRTRNFITTNPKNLQIRTWNGIPLEPVEHNPFTHSATPVEGDPFGVQGQVP